MEWKEPVVGQIRNQYEYRIITRFLVLPLRIGDTTRMWVTVKIQQKRLRTENYLGMWSNEKWAD